MAEKDLIPVTNRTKDEQKRICSAGGVASGRSRRLKKALRECLRADLEQLALGADGKPLLDRDGQEYSQGMAMARQYLVNVQKKLKAGDTKQFESMLELVEGKTVNVGGSDTGEPIRIEPKVPELTPEQMLEIARMHQPKK